MQLLRVLICMPDILKEQRFKSGKRIFYIFESPLSDFDLDELEELKSFQLLGPLSESMPEESPRYNEYLSSRYVLLQLLKSFKKRQLGGLAFSLSHTKEAVLVAAAPTLAFEEAALSSGVGADLENSQRKISESAHKRIVNGGKDAEVPALLLWSLKEAAYKAHPNNPDLLLSDFFVSEIYDEDNYELICTPSHKSFEALCVRNASFQIVLAMIQ